MQDIDTENTGIMEGQYPIYICHYSAKNAECQSVRNQYILQMNQFLNKVGAVEKDFFYSILIQFYFIFEISQCQSDFTTMAMKTDRQDAK